MSDFDFTCSSVGKRALTLAPVSPKGQAVAIDGAAVLKCTAGRG